MLEYGFTKEISLPFEDAVELVKEKLKIQKFGVLTTINVQEKFKEKLGIDFKKYVILGACNPQNAHRAIVAEENIGLMLPCNVVVYEKGDKTVVSVIKPTAVMGMIANENLKEIATTVEAQLKAVFDAIK